jgi:hypothetical protein
MLAENFLKEYVFFGLALDGGRTNLAIVFLIQSQTNQIAIRNNSPPPFYVPYQCKFPENIMLWYVGHVFVFKDPALVIKILLPDP